MELELKWKWRRKVLRIRDSLYVSIPFAYVEASGIKRGQYVDLTVNQNGSLNISKEVANVDD